MEKITKYLDKHIDTYRLFLPKRLYQLTAILGAAYSVYKAFSYIRRLGCLVSIQKNLPRRYGKGTWAVVTGATEGLGKSFAFKLAEQGFNIVLIARNPDKLNTTAQEISKQHGVSTRTIVADFTQSLKDGFYGDIEAKLKDLDVSILVNNVAISFKGNIIDGDPKAMNDTCYVNMYSQVGMTNILLNRMMQREKRSAIISISSVMGTVPIAGRALYSATKAFNDHFSKALSYAYNSKIDMMTVRPQWIRTRWISNFPHFFSIPPDELVDGALNELGKCKVTYGHWKHRIIGPLYKHYPFFRNWSHSTLQQFRLKQSATTAPSK